MVSLYNDILVLEPGAKFRITADFAAAYDAVADREGKCHDHGTTPRLDAWLAKPEAIIPGAIIAYRQPKAETRAAIIAYLKELN